MSQSQPSARLHWVDSSKGLAIVLVVIHHSVLILEQVNLLTGPWLQINNAFQVLRMPLFFTAAGLFVSSALARPWKTLWGGRLSLYVWIFAVWTLIRFGYFLAFPMEARPDETDPWLLLLAPLLPSTGLWFLHALFCFIVVAKMLNGRIGYQFQIMAAAILSIGLLSYPGGNISWTGMGKYFFFFLAGCYLRDHLLRLAAAATWTRVAVSGCTFGAGVVIMSVFNLQLFGPFGFAVRLAAVLFGFLMAATIADSWLGRILGMLGKRTLEIYVTHVLVISFICSVLAALDAIPDFITLALPLVMTVVATTASLGIHAALTSVPGLAVLYETPSRVKGNRLR